MRILSEPLYLASLLKNYVFAIPVAFSQWKHIPANAFEINNCTFCQPSINLIPANISIHGRKYQSKWEMILLRPYRIPMCTTVIWRCSWLCDNKYSMIVKDNIVAVNVMPLCMRNQAKRHKMQMHGELSNSYKCLNKGMFHNVIKCRKWKYAQAPYVQILRFHQKNDSYHYERSRIKWNKFNK